MNTTPDFRIEMDALGSLQVPAEALYGIHSLRAKKNFPDTGRFSPVWYKSMGKVKLACYETVISFKNAIRSKYGDKELPFNLPDQAVLEALIHAAGSVSEGRYFEEFIVPATSGGAGTSINMNVNEIIANLALISTGHRPGDYTFIDPIETANIYQSTNDVVPTALKIAVMEQLNLLEESINRLRAEVERVESENRNELRVGYTQMQEAVPSSFGKLFSTYSEALSRDWWRVSKCFERIKVVNLGGSAIGTGIGVPRFFIMEVIPALQRLTQLPVTRSENLQDATANLDSFVEVHAILKSFAVNLEKMVADIRLLASDLVKTGNLRIPQQQVGSSIMPGKINPVIPEFVISIAHKVYSNDMLLSSLSAQGCLELNPYLPSIGHAILESLQLLISASDTLTENLFKGLEVKKGAGVEQLMNSPSITTALSPYIGYHKASLLAKEMKASSCSIEEANEKLGSMDPGRLKKLLKTENLLKTGFTLEDVLE